ncbi:MAG: hypothetical protein E7619_00570 [Ruminococcaceae bacterium]|nr:hypothetical protein [Oscillospiraceae bacterium]
MSLQSDFQLCLEYAEALEDKQDKLTQAQNNIIFTRNESVRLKDKLRLCTKLSVLFAIGIAFFTYMLISFRTIEPISILLVIIIAFIISFSNRVKTKKEFDELESKKDFLIQQNTELAEECRSEITELIKEIYRENLFDIVPMDYFSVEAIEFCLTQVRKKLANTATEAFQQLEDEIKRLEQMARLEQMNTAQMEQLENIKRAIHINTLVTLIEQDKNKR